MSWVVEALRIAVTATLIFVSGLISVWIWIWVSNNINPWLGLPAWVASVLLFTILGSKILEGATTE